MKEKLLVVDDEESIRATFSAMLKSSGYRVETAETLSACVKQMQAERFDLIFLDVWLGAQNTLETIERLRVMQPACEVVVIAGNLDSKSIAEARRQGAADCLGKPVRQASLLYVVRKVLDARPAPAGQLEGALAS